MGVAGLLYGDYVDTVELSENFAWSVVCIHTYIIYGVCMYMYGVCIYRRMDKTKPNIFYSFIIYDDYTRFTQLEKISNIIKIEI